MYNTNKDKSAKISIAVTLLIVSVSVILIAIIGNSTFDDYVAERDQRNLLYALEDCKSLFGEGLEREDCMKKSINAFGTHEQKQELMSVHYDP